MLEIDEAVPVGPAPLAAGARLHDVLRVSEVDVVVLTDSSRAGWGVLEARRSGLAHAGCVVVAVIAGPARRLRTVDLERALDLHGALGERIDDHLIANADVVVAVDDAAAEWCAAQRASSTDVVQLSDAGAAFAVIEQRLLRLRADVQIGVPRSQLPAVTAVVTHYNRPDMVRRAVASLLCQTYENLDIVVVDDGSTHPHAAATLDELERRSFPRPLQVLRKANGGLGSARNEGLRRASGDLVVFLDDDDEAEPTYVERMATAIATTGAAAAVVGFRVMPQTDTGPLETLDEQLQWMYFSPAADLAVLDNVIGGAAAMFRKEVALAVGGFHEIRHLTYEDWALLVKVALAGHDIVPVPEALLRYRVSPGSMLRTFPLWGSRDQLFDAYRTALPPVLHQWPELVYGLHEQVAKLLADRARLTEELATARAELAAAHPQLAELRAVAAHREAMLASRSWRVGSSVVGSVGTAKRAAKRLPR